MVELVNALAMVGEFSTIRVALAGSGLELPSNVVTAPIAMVLTYEPATAAVTGTVIKQVEFAAKVPPVKLTVPPPGVAVSVPPQALPVAPAATVTPAGRVSVKPPAVRGKFTELKTEILSVEIPPVPMVLGLKFLLILTLRCTVRVALGALVLVAN